MCLRKGLMGSLGTTPPADQHINSGWNQSSWAQRIGINLGHDSRTLGLEAAGAQPGQ